MQIEANGAVKLILDQLKYYSMQSILSNQDNNYNANSNCEEQQCYL